MKMTEEKANRIDEQEALARELGFSSFSERCQHHVNEQSPGSDWPNRVRMAKDLENQIIETGEELPRAWFELQ